MLYFYDAHRPSIQFVRNELYYIVATRILPYKFITQQPCFLSFRADIAHPAVPKKKFYIHIYLYSAEWFAM